MFPSRFTVLSLIVMMAARTITSDRQWLHFNIFEHDRRLYRRRLQRCRIELAARCFFRRPLVSLLPVPSPRWNGFELFRTDATVSLSFNRSDVFVKHEWYAHRTLRNLFIEEIRVTAKTSGKTSVPLVDLGITGADPNDYSGTTVINTTLVKIQGDAITANVTLYRTAVTEVPSIGQVSVCRPVSR